MQRCCMINLMMSTDRPSMRVSGAARSMLLFGNAVDLPDSIEAIKRVTPEELYDTARELDYADFSAYTLR